MTRTNLYRLQTIIHSSARVQITRQRTRSRPRDRRSRASDRTNRPSDAADSNADASAVSDEDGGSIWRKACHGVTRGTHTVPCQCGRVSGFRHPTPSTKHGRHCCRLRYCWRRRCYRHRRQCCCCFTAPAAAVAAAAAAYCCRQLPVGDEVRLRVGTAHTRLHATHADGRAPYLSVTRMSEHLNGRKQGEARAHSAGSHRGPREELQRATPCAASMGSRADVRGARAGKPSAAASVRAHHVFLAASPSAVRDCLRKPLVYAHNYGDTGRSPCRTVSRTDRPFEDSGP